MAVGRSLKRLVRVRALEEEQCMAALETAVIAVRRLESELETNRQRTYMGRELVHRSAGTGEVIDRQAGLANVHLAECAAKMLTEDLDDARDTVKEKRAEFLARRVEKRQAETLLEAAMKRAANKHARSLQRDVEDWGRARRMPRRRAESLGSADHTAMPAIDSNGSDDDKLSGAGLRRHTTRHVQEKLEVEVLGEPPAGS